MIKLMFEKRYFVTNDDNIPLSETSLIMDIPS